MGSQLSRKDPVWELNEVNLERMERINETAYWKEALGQTSETTIAQPQEQHEQRGQREECLIDLESIADSNTAVAKPPKSILSPTAAPFFPKSTIGGSSIVRRASADTAFAELDPFAKCSKNIVKSSPKNSNLQKSPEPTKTSNLWKNTSANWDKDVVKDFPKEPDLQKSTDLPKTSYLQKVLLDIQNNTKPQSNSDIPKIPNLQKSPNLQNISDHPKPPNLPKSSPIKRAWLPIKSHPLAAYLAAAVPLPPSEGSDHGSHQTEPPLAAATSLPLTEAQDYQSYRREPSANIFESRSPSPTEAIDDAVRLPVLRRHIQFFLWSPIYRSVFGREAMEKHKLNVAAHTREASKFARLFENLENEEVGPSKYALMSNREQLWHKQTLYEKRLSTVQKAQQDLDAALKALAHDIQEVIAGQKAGSYDEYLEKLDRVVDRALSRLQRKLKALDERYEAKEKLAKEQWSQGRMELLEWNEKWTEKYADLMVYSRV